MRIVGAIADGNSVFVSRVSLIDDEAKWQSRRDGVNNLITSFCALHNEGGKRRFK